MHINLYEEMKIPPSHITHPWHLISNKQAMGPSESTPNLGLIGLEPWPLDAPVVSSVQISLRIWRYILRTDVAAFCTIFLSSTL